MKFSKQHLPALLLISALALPIQKLHAQVILVKLNIALTATYQLENTGPTNNASATKQNTTTARMTTPSLLSLLAATMGASFASGASLALVGDNVVVLDKQGNQTDVSSFFSTSSETSVVKGQSNGSTGAATTTSTTYTTIHFDDGNGNAFTIDGLLKTTETITAMDANGNQKATISLSGTMAGYGSLAGSGAVFSGSVSGSGKGTMTGG